MKNTLFLLSIIVFAASLSTQTPVFSCEQGCQDDSECPNNAHCVAINQNSDCGLCLCKAGFKTSGNDCVPNKQHKPNGGGGGGTGSTSTIASTISATGGESTVTTTSGPPSSISISTTQAGPTTQGPPPTPAPINCTDFKCAPTFPSSSDSDNPFTVRAVIYNDTDKCKNRLANPGRPCKMQGGGVCYGIYCLTVDPTTEYCICELNRVDRQCAVEKPGKCDSATNKLPPNGFKAQNKRYRNKNNPDMGSIYARHFAANFDDCIKLCTWSSDSCRAVNYGPLGGQQVCELLSTAVTKGSILESWMVDAPGWQHAQVVLQ